MRPPCRSACPPHKALAGGASRGRDCGFENEKEDKRFQITNHEALLRIAELQ